MQISSNENQPTRAVSRNKNYWREIIATWQKSNEHPNDFCERMSIKMGTFAHWRSIFAKENKKKENKFITLRITEPAQDKVDPFIIECPSGHKIVFASAIKTEQRSANLKLLGLIT